MEVGGVLGSEVLRRQMVNIKCLRKVESDGYLVKTMEFLVGRLKRDIIGALGNQYI